MSGKKGHLKNGSVIIPVHQHLMKGSFCILPSGLPADGAVYCHGQFR